jgi:hypothetical protein
VVQRRARVSRLPSVDVRRSEEVAMAAETPKWTCPGCRGTNLRLRAIVNAGTFRSTEAGFFSLNYPLGAFVCLDCGLVGHYMKDTSLEKLRGKQA